MRTKFVLLMAVYFIFYGAADAAADSIGVPIRATIIQCGSRADIKLSCEKDDRCCVFLDLAPVASEDQEQPPPPGNSDIVVAGNAPDYFPRPPFVPR